jgi:transcriptional regulator with XRE-family HTH domain
MDNLVQINGFFKELGTQLRTLRNETKQTIDQVSEWTGVERKQIIKIESGDSRNFENICKYCEKFDLFIDFKFNHK